MVKKVLGRYCAKLHQVETTVQSLANDGIRVLADRRHDQAERTLLGNLERVLHKDFGGPGSPAAISSQAQPQVDFAALRRLRLLGRLGRLPETVLRRLAGPLQVPKRWYGTQVCVVVLTKDEWLHCFHLAPPKQKAQKAEGGGSSSVQSAGVPEEEAEGLGGLDAVEAEPQWSMYVPGVIITAPVPGKPRSFEIEEVKKGFLGIKSSRKELFQVESEDGVRRWASALSEAGALLHGAAAAAATNHEFALRQVPVPPPPPPPPPPLPEAEVVPEATAPETDVATSAPGQESMESAPEPRGAPINPEGLQAPECSPVRALTGFSPEDVFGM